jgi:hypothetical protein
LQTEPKVDFLLPGMAKICVLNVVLFITANIPAFSCIARLGAGNDRGSFTGLISETK